MKTATVALLLLLLVAFGCVTQTTSETPYMAGEEESGAPADYGGYEGWDYEGPSQEAPQEVTSAWETAFLKGKRLTVEFVKDTVGMPKYRQWWKVIYDFKENPPTLYINMTERCIEGCSPAIPQERSVWIDYKHRKAQGDVCSGFEELSPEECFMRPTVYKRYAEMVGMLYENGEFVDIDTEGPIVYEDLLSALRHVGSGTYKGAQAEIYADEFGNKWYLFRNYYILGPERPSAILHTPTKHASEISVAVE